MEEQDSEEQYLEFISADIPFLLPVLWVKKVIEKNGEAEEVPVFDVSGGVRRDVPGERSFLILLENEGKTVGIPADRVIGVRKTAPKRLLMLEEPVLNENNRYLKAAAVTEEAGKELLELVLKPEILMEAAGEAAAKRERIRPDVS